MNSLTRRAFAIFILVSAIVGFCGMLLILLFLPDAGFILTERQLQRRSEELVGNLRTCTPDDAASFLREFESASGTELSLLTADRIVLNPYTLQRTGTRIADSGTEYPFRFAGDSTEYFLFVPDDLRRTVQFVHVFGRCAPFILCITLLLSLLFAKLFSYWAVQPIRRVSRIAKHMAELDFSWYCPDVREDEIGTLSGNLNLLSDKLQAALKELNERNQTLQDEIAIEKERERRRMLFLSGVTHELKTPVAVVIGQLEGMQANIGVYRDHGKYLARCAEIMQSLNDFIREILLVSHLDMTDAGPAPEMNLSAALHELTADHAAYAEENAITFHTEIAPELPVHAEPMLLKKALGNILGNAVTHTPAQGDVRVRLQKTESGAVLTVENTPAQIAPEHLPHVFEAFYRADPAAKHSSGLGLYITATILDLYHMPYRIENTGTGVLFTVEMPESCCGEVSPMVSPMDL